MLPGITPVRRHGDALRSVARVAARSSAIALPDDHGTTYGQRASDHDDAGVPRAVVVRAESHDTCFLTISVMDYVDAHAGDDPGWAVHLSRARAASAVDRAGAVQRALSAAIALPGSVRRDDVEAEGEQHPWLAYQLFRPQRIARRRSATSNAAGEADYGLMSEVDDNIGRLFAHLKAIGAVRRHADRSSRPTTASRSAITGCSANRGYFDQSYHIPMIVRDARRNDEGAGRRVHRTRRRHADDARVDRHRRAAGVRRPGLDPLPDDRRRAARLAHRSALGIRLPRLADTKRRLG